MPDSALHASPLPSASDPTRLYRFLRAVVRTLLHLFFREVTAAGTHHVPLDRGGLLVAGHPNGVIDPAVILSRFPGRLVFGARDGLLKWAVVGPLMRGLGTVPIYRAADHAGADGGGPAGEAARRDANARSLDALAAEAASGSFTALFPEGQSHDLAHPTEIRSGAARLYARALVLAAEAGRPVPALLPVGLHYDAKATFRSRALVAFHRPLAVPDTLRARLAGPPEAPDTRAAVQELTDLIEHALHSATFAADDWDLVRTMHRARTLVRAEDAVRTDARVAPETAEGRALGMAQIWTGYRARIASHPAEIAALRRDVDAYDRGLRALGMDDADLDRPPRVAGALGLVLAGLALAPVAAVGFVVNGPPHRLLRALAPRFARAEKDTATVKLFGGLVLYPAAWLVAGVLVALIRAHLGDLPVFSVRPLAAGALAVGLSAVGAAAALWASEQADGARRALRVRLTRDRRRAAVARLLAARAELHDRFLALTPGLDLPETLA